MIKKPADTPAPRATSCKAGQNLNSRAVDTRLAQAEGLARLVATKDHLSVFPFSSRLVDAVRDRLAGFELAKGTIRFTVAMTLPDEVVRDVVRLRSDEIAATAR